MTPAWLLVLRHFRSVTGSLYGAGVDDWCSATATPPAHAAANVCCQSGGDSHATGVSRNAATFGNVGPGPANAFTGGSHLRRNSGDVGSGHDRRASPVALSRASVVGETCDDRRGSPVCAV